MKIEHHVKQQELLELAEKFNQAFNEIAEPLMDELSFKDASKLCNVSFKFDETVKELKQIVYP